MEVLYLFLVQSFLQYPYRYQNKRVIIAPISKERYMSDLKKTFEETVDYVQNADGDVQLSNEQKLQMYALYKQSTAGDVSGKKPGMMDFVARAKYSAWEELKGLSSDEAMQKYINEVKSFKS